MPDKDQANNRTSITPKEINPEMDPSEIPAIPLKPEEVMDIIPDEEEYEPPAFEVPEPGEGP